MPLFDLIQEGNVGLLEAAGRYNAETGNRFSTYAIHMIEYTIKRALATKLRMIKIPERMVYAINKMKRVQSELSSELGRPPTIEELAVRMGKTLFVLREMLSYDQSMLSLDMPTNNSNGMPLLSNVASPDRTYDGVNTCVNVLLCKYAFSLLKNREALILMYRYGFFGRVYTFEEIAPTFGVTRQAIQKSVKRSLERLASFLETFSPNFKDACNFFGRLDLFHTDLSNNEVVSALEMTKISGRYCIYDYLCCNGELNLDMICAIDVALRNLSVKDLFVIQKLFGNDFDLEHYIDPENMSEYERYFVGHILIRLRCELSSFGTNQRICYR